MSRRPTGRPSRRLLVLAGALAAAGCADPPAAQPIPFNHRLHATTNQIECVQCHEGVLTAARAGLPRVEICMECHASDITENPAAKPHIELIRRHAAAGTEIPWQKLYLLPAHVYYSHRRHVAIARVECAVCHGDIADAATPPPGPVARTLAMSTCMDCHEARGVPNECVWCHR
jgi:hypothetical protein